MRFREDIPIKEVTRLYVEEEKSVVHIARLFHTSPSIICDRMDLAGAARRPLVRHDVSDIDIKEMYVGSQLSIRAISERVQCSRETVRCRLKSMGVVLRPNTKEHMSDEVKKRISEAKKGYCPSEYARRKVSEANTGPGNGNWRGGKSYEPYCPAFTEKLKEEVRAAFQRKCYVCHTPEVVNARKLSVHHVDYQKSQGCRGQRWSLIPLCNSCHSKTNRDRWYWFALLRDYWIYEHIDFNSNPF